MAKSTMAAKASSPASRTRTKVGGAETEAVPSVVDALLRNTLVSAARLHGTGLGNIQLVDWNRRELMIAVNLGFDQEFLDAFRSVRPNDGSVCAHAVRERKAVLAEDVFADREFAPYREIARKAGFRAVLSIPLISSRNAFVGVLSVHFPEVHRPTAEALSTTQAMATAAADELLRALGRST
jgi:GAF domain-containing protein